MSAYALMEIERRLANMIRFGTVTEVNTDEKRAKVDVGGDVITEWLQWLTPKAGEDRHWHAPDIGEQVIVFSPGGDLTQGVIGPALFQDDFPENGDDVNVSRMTYKDGSVVEYDRDGHALNITLTDNATLTVTIGQSKLEMTKDEVKLHAKPGGSTKLGNNPTQHASIGEKTLQQLQKITNYLQILAAVWSSPIPEAGMGSPSSFATALNIAHNAAGGIPTMDDPSASEVLVK